MGGSLSTIEQPVELDETGKAAVITTAMALGVDASNAKAYSLGCGMELMPDPDRRLTLTRREGRAGPAAPEAGHAHRRRAISPASAAP